jgi:hypothetical protein
MYEKTAWFFEEFEGLLESVCTQKGIVYDITLTDMGFFKTTYKFWMRGTEAQLRAVEKELGV